MGFSVLAAQEMKRQAKNALPALLLAPFSACILTLILHSLQATPVQGFID